MMLDSLHSALALSGLFRDCSIDSTLFSLRRYSKNQMIDDVLDGAAAIGLVVSGQVDVYSVSVDGRDILLRTLHKGDCFGLHNLLMEAEVQTVLYCAKTAVIGYISRTDLLGIMAGDQKLTLQYARICSGDMQVLLRRIEHLTIQTCRGRLISYLLSQRRADGRICLSCSREDLARHLGMSRATLFRELAALQKQGVVKNQKGVLWAPDAHALEQLFLLSSQ